MKWHCAINARIAPHDAADAVGITRCTDGKGGFYLATRKKNKTHKVRTFLVSLLLVCITTAAICGIAFAWYIHTYINPNIDLDINALGMNFTSIIYAKEEGSDAYVEYEKLHGTENRIWADLNTIPKELGQAFVAIEDQRFYTHGGVDWKRTAGAVVDWVTGKGSYGGSTLTQQLIKNMTDDDDYSVKRKITEILRALALEKKLDDKDKILELYMNTIYLGRNAYGVKTAAMTYFNTPLEQLSLAQCAALAGITNNPSYYDPFRFPENTKKRQTTILSEMQKQQMITESEYAAAVAEPLNYQRPADEGENAEPYSYFTDTVIRDVINDLVEQKGYSRQLANALVTSGGLKIYATVDTKVQNIMEEVYADEKNFPKISKNGLKPESAMVITTPQGEIAGIIGGRGEKTGSLGLNRATQSVRQPGSSIKPISVYGPAMDAGLITPYTGLVDEPFKKIDGKDWPRNDNRQYTGPIILKNAVARSVNTIAVKVLAELTPQASYEFLTEKLGVKSLVGSRTTAKGTVQTDIDLAPLALGGLTDGMTVREMAAAYTIFPNDGKFIKPHTYTKVVDSDGAVLLSNEELQPVVAFENEKTSYYMNEVLQGVTTSGGTAASAKIKGMATAGKTGTTTANKDRWFCGYTPYYVGACWFGYDKEYNLSGLSSNPATNLWKAVMSRIHEDLPDKNFEKNEDFISRSYCTITGLKPNTGCTTASGSFAKGDEPKENCAGHAVEPLPEDPNAILPGDIDPETGLPVVPPTTPVTPPTTGTPEGDGETVQPPNNTGGTTPPAGGGTPVPPTEEKPSGGGTTPPPVIPVDPEVDPE